MFYYKEFINPVTGDTEKHFVKVLDNGDYIFFSPNQGPLVEAYQAWLAEGNEAAKWE